MQTAGRTLDVLVKVDVGFHRCGIDPDGDAASTSCGAIAKMPGLNLRGLLSHAGHGYHAASEDELRAIARSEAETLTLDPRRARPRLASRLDELSVGATPTLRFSAAEHRLTELRPGNYVYFDRTQVALGAASLDDCALTVLATVVSKHPGRHHPRLRQQDADERSGARDHDGARLRRGARRADGASLESTSLTIERLSEEHATVRVDGDTASARRPRAHRAQPLVRGVEPGRRRAAR